MSEVAMQPASLFKRLRASRATRWAIDGLLVVAVVIGIGAYQSRYHVRGDAPAFAFAERDGTVVTNATFLGKPTLLVFWAPWCTVCRVESSNISRVARWVGEHAHVVSVASAYDDVTDVDKYVLDVGVDYPVLLGGEDGARAFRVRAYPTVYFLDDKGRISGSVVGYTTTAGLLARLLL